MSEELAETDRGSQSGSIGDHGQEDVHCEGERGMEGREGGRLVLRSNIRRDREILHLLLVIAA